jgi:hypothetical protein
MLAPTDRSGRPLTAVNTHAAAVPLGAGKRGVEILEEKKRLLSLICAADRVEFQQTCERSVANPKVQLATHLLAYADVIADAVPGRLGVVLRKATLFARVGRQLGFLW